MESTNIVNKRMNWLDWMKAIGMYLIVYGHFLSYGHEFIYTFSVPLFFVISGFLFKKEESLRIFIKKNFYNLLLPMIIMVILVQIRKNISDIINGTFTFERFQQYFIALLVGDQKVLGACWFIYTLFIIKLMLQILPQNKHFRIVLLILFSIGSIILSHKGMFVQNSVVNVLLSYPFFYVGIKFYKYKVIINKAVSPKYSCLMFMMAFFITYMCSVINVHVWVYINDYGKSFLLYLLGGISGTVLIYIVCKSLDMIKSSVVATISNGSILILGLHLMFVEYVKITPSLDFISALVLLFIFVPIIKICEKYFPFICGVYRIKNEV